MSENWKEIPGYEGFYEVSDLGRIRSIARVVPTRSGTRRVRSTVRSLTPTGEAGYLATLLSVRNHKSSMKAHIAVLLAFIGPRPSPGHDGCHNDGDISNNRLSNLRWDTKSGNNQDKKRHGTAQVGSSNPAAKLTEAQVGDIQRRLSAETLSALAREFGVSVTAVWQIKHKLKWEHVP